MSVTAWMLLALAAGAGLTLTAIDLRSARIPDAANATLALCGPAFHWLADWHYATATELLLGSLFGAGFFYAAREVYARWRGLEAIGLGDVKFMAAAGLWVGLSGIAPLILVAALTTLAALALRHGAAITSEAWRRRRIPFGPGLAVGLAVVVAGQLLGVWRG